MNDDTHSSSANGSAANGSHPDGHEADAAHLLAPHRSGLPAAAPTPWEVARFGVTPDLSFTDPRQVIQQAVQIVKARWGAGLLAAIVVGALAGALLFHFRPIEFTAQTTLLAQSREDQVLNPSSAPTSDDLQETALNNHLAVMLSRSFRERVADTFTPDETKRIEAPYLKAGEPPSRAIMLGLLAAKVHVTREREQDIFTIAVKHVDGDDALLIANRFATTYLGLAQSGVHEADRAAAAVLRQQAGELSQEIMALEDQRRAYRRDHNLISPEENRNILDDRIKQVNLARADLRVQRFRLQAEVDQARRDLAQTSLPFTNATLSAYAGTDDLRKQLQELQVQRDVLALRYGPKHARIVELDGDIAATRAALERNYRNAFADLQSRLSVAIASELGLSAEFDAAFQESLALSRNAANLAALQQEEDNKRRTLDGLFLRIGKATVDSNLPAQVLQIVDPAYIRHPAVPMLAIYVVAIGLLSLGGFILAPLAINFFDDRINDRVDFEHKHRLGVIGVIPRLGGLRNSDRPHIVRDNADLAYAEAFLALASQIDLVSRKDLPRCLIVTSTLPGEGKSTVASNLAAAYTRLGRRTALVDCDFRRPAQRAIHQIGGEAGLLPWARAGFHDNPDLLKVGGPVDATALPDGTFLIPAGTSDVQPGRYLMADGMGRFLGRLREAFDVVVIDSPPAGVFQDALILARHCDETVFVARDGMANTRQFVRTAQDFGKTQAPVLGVILNGFSPSAPYPKLYHKKLYLKYGYDAPGKGQTAGAAG